MALQRFCPLCNRAFLEGEAVLCCSGCSVLHHPGCWVKHDGCATESDHLSNPTALAYSRGLDLRGPDPHPGEGTRVRPLPRAGEATAAAVVVPHAREMVGGEMPVREAGFKLSPRASGAAAGGGGIDLPMQPAGSPWRAHRGRFIDEAARRRELGRIYGHHRLLKYWPFVAAAALAAGIAFAVVKVSGELAGSGGGARDEARVSQPAEAPVSQPAANVQPAPASPASATLTGTTAPGPAAAQQPAAQAPQGAAPTAGGKFAVGDSVVVTGAGDCLNVRVAAGRSNDAIVCLADGNEITVTGGPEGADGLRWWKVKTKLGEGWAAEDYLVTKP